MVHPEPYLSVVVTSRNDDHGHSLLRRMQTFINALIGQCKRHGLQAELVLVEWNPPPDRPRFREALRWPEQTDPCQVRIIEVPPEVHRRLKHSENLPLFQMIAKNVGIRRARGRFILATNIDILLSDELVRALARGELRRGRMYRIDRHDVMSDVPVFADVTEQLRYCETHLLRLNCREGTFELKPDGRRTVAAEDVASADMDVSFEQGWYPVERWNGEVYRWVGQDAVLVVPVPAGPPKALCLEIEPGPGVANAPFELQVRDSREQILARGWIECRQRIYLTMPLRPGVEERLQLHTVGGGRPISFDPRILNFRVVKCCWADVPAPRAVGETHPENVHFCVEDTYVLAKEDIATPEMGLRFGRGWHGFERWNGEPFRWVGDDARLAVTLPSASTPVLTLEVEPGPGVELRSFGLQVRDALGRTVARGFVGGRQLIFLTLPLSPGQTRYFQLHTEGGGRPIPNSSRILNFRVLRCAWTDGAHIVTAQSPSPGTFQFVSGEVFQRAKEDIAAADMGLRFGGGWYPVECNHGVLSRWAGDDAGIAVEAPAEEDPVLSLELQPGPGVGNGSFTLQVQDRAGKAVAQGVVDGRQVVHLLLPVRPGQAEYYRLHVPGGGRRIPSDPRILNFNVLRCFWSKNWQAIPAFAQPGDAYNFKTEDVYLLADNDIAPGAAGIRFGCGWYPAEVNQDGLSRWVGNNARIALSPPTGADTVLSLEVQPGPGVDHHPFLLQVRNRVGRTVAQGVVDGRQVVHLLLPVRPGEAEYYRLHVPGGGRRIPSDPRILNFNVLRCFWSKNWEGIRSLPQPEDAHHLKTEDVYMLANVDIASPEMGLRFGRGWYPVELNRGVPYRWAGNDAAIAIDARADGEQVLSFELQPGPGVGPQPFILCVNDADGRTVAQGFVDGPKVVHLLLPLRQGQEQHFWLRAVGGGKQIATDTRILDFHVSRCHWSHDWETIPVSEQPPHAVRFKTESPYELAADDIASAGMGLRFGQGWYPVERNGGVLHRWVGDDARFVVDAPAGPARVLSLEMEPGPGVEYRPFTLHVLDASGKLVAQGMVAGHKVVHLLLPLKQGQTNRFTLHAPEGGRRLTTDPRILNFSVFRCSWSEEWERLIDFCQPVDAFNVKTEDPYVLEAEDIASPDTGLRFGPGWHAVERNHGIVSRWVGENASLAVTAPHGPARALCLELEPGPGVGYGPFHLQVQDGYGQTVQRVAVDGHTVVELLLPCRADGAERFWLHAEGGGRRTANDARIMNFSVFRCFWSDQPSVALPGVESDGVRSNGLAVTHRRSVVHDSDGLDDGCAAGRTTDSSEAAGECTPAAQDIVSVEMGLHFGAGWGPLEQDNGQWYRRACHGAHVAIEERSDTPVKTLSLDLEPDPALAGNTVEVQIRDPQGRIHAQETVSGRRVAHFMLRVRPGKVEHFELHLRAAGPLTSGELTEPALRVFHCNWSTPGSTVPDHEIISPLPLHTCACGDFTLLAREDWFELLGYPEFELFSLHIDSVFCYQAHHHGIVEELLQDPMRIYHIEHGTGSGWTPEGAAKLMERIAAKGIPCLECQEVLAWATEMRRRNRPLVLNYADWGLPDDVLPETVVGQTAL